MPLEIPLGLWIEQTEGASFWLRVMTELKSRGVDDILIALIDGLVGFPEAITTVFPETQVHHCVVHLVRQSLAFAGWKERKRLAVELRTIYRGPTDAAATKLLYLALRNIMLKWQRGNHAWQAAMPHRSLLFGPRFTDHA